MLRTNAALLYIYNILLVLAACVQATGNCNNLVQAYVKFVSACIDMQPEYGISLYNSQTLFCDAFPYPGCAL